MSTSKIRNSYGYHRHSLELMIHAKRYFDEAKEMFSLNQVEEGEEQFDRGYDLLKQALDRETNSRRKEDGNDRSRYSR